MNEEYLIKDINLSNNYCNMEIADLTPYCVINVIYPLNIKISGSTIN